jgi:hypothetical protein
MTCRSREAGMVEMDERSLTDSSRIKARNAQAEEAVFLGWQITRSGAAYPLYNVTAEGHPYFGSTVSDQTLRKLNLQVPNTPPIQGSSSNF